MNHNSKLINHKSPELLAPAGSFASLRAGIDAGADAVYFGISDFNMRATASVNFKPTDLKKLTTLCKEHNVKTYLTVNTLMYDDDIERMKKVVQLAKQHEIDAIIAADIATIQYAFENEVEVHISTQISIANIEAVKFYSQFADRMVLARELNLDQVAEIINQIKKQNITGPKGKLIEIEVFAHGALCVAVSGRCAMSLFHTGRSANRGQCSQICRRPFKVTDIASGKELVVDNNFVMSSADLCTIGMLDELVKTGVACLKFEGRGRKPEYVNTVISTYKEALQSIKEGTYTTEKVEKWNQDLGTVYNRGFTQNFFMGRKIDEWSRGSGSKATTKRVQIGIVQKYYPKINIAQILIQAKETLKIGEKYIVTSDKTGLVTGTIQSMMIDDTKVESADQGSVVTFEVEMRVRKGDEVYVIRKS